MTKYYSSLPTFLKSCTFPFLTLLLSIGLGLTSAVFAGGESGTKGKKPNFTIPFSNPVFIENLGQYDAYVTAEKKKEAMPFFGARIGKETVLFGANYMKIVDIKIEREDEEKERERKKNGKTEGREIDTYVYTLEWIGANPEAKAISEKKVSEYFTFTDPKNPSKTFRTNGFEQISIENLYPGIDLFYSLERAGGIKYSFRIAPGADPSLIKMKWNGVKGVELTPDGNLSVHTGHEFITDEKPISFYENDKNNTVGTRFSLKGNIISFEVDPYDTSKPLIIDPWTTSITLNYNNKAFDIAMDAAGFIYAYGGSNPYQMKKYTPTGSPLWTYNTSANGYYGDFCLDSAANIYIIYGPWGDQCIKLDSSSSSLFNVSSGPNSYSIETYRILMNPISDSLTVIGMEILSGGLTPIIFHIDPITGNYAPKYAHPTNSSSELRDLAIDTITGDSYTFAYSGSGSPNFYNDNLLWKVATPLSQVWSINSGYSLSEIDPSYADEDFSGHNGLTVGCSVYTFDGETVYRRDKSTGALLDSAVVPGGVQYQIGGICSDPCSNIYVGAPDSVLMFDYALNQIGSVYVGADVFDVCNGQTLGEILVAGDGFIASVSFSVSPCGSGTLSVSNDTSICGGDTIQLFANGGGSITWTPATGLSNASIYNPFAFPTVTTTYTVNSVDPSTCSLDTASITVNVSPGINLNFTAVDNVSCAGSNDGGITVNITGGTNPLSYVWNSTPPQTTQNLSNVPGGTYTLLVTDSLGCSASQSATISEPAAVTLSTQVTHVTCFGGANGTASVSINGGTAPYQYAWNSTPPQFTALATGLSGGTYTVVVLDANNCSYTTTVTVNEPAELIIDQLVSVNANCASQTGNGSASIVASGGTSPYSYYWNSNPPQTTQTATNLPAGTYTGIVTDNNGCVVSGSVTVQIDQNPVADAGPDMFFCIGSGGVQLDGTASGGVAPYIYVWAPNNGSLNYTYVEDPTANPDSATTYYFYVIGDNGCMSNIDSVVVTPVDIPVVDVGADEWRCPTDVADFITATVLNPVGGYSVQWTPSIGLYCDTCLTTYATPDTTTVYCAVVTSLLTGCSSDPTTLNSLSCLTYTVRPRPVADAGPDIEICEGDSITTCGIATSAGPQYAFAWSPNYGVNDSTLVCPNFSPPNTTWYTLVVTSNSCPSYADSVLVTVRPTLTADAGQVRTICANDSVQLDGQYNGMATATGFIWSPAAGLSDSTAQTPMASPASTTWYYFTVFNGLCPSDTDSVQVIVNQRPIANAGPDLQLCPEGDSITISGATATSGLPPYTYLWQPSSGLQNASLLNPNLKPDTTTLYTLTVFTGTAPNVCTDIDTMLVTVKPGLNLMLDIDTNTICQGQIAQLTSSAGSGSAVFSWSPTLGLSNPNAANTLANPDTTVTYYLTATEHGCSSIDSIRIRVLGTPDAAFTASSTQSCGELSVAFLNLSADGSAYEWNFGDGNISNQTSPLHTYTQPGTYTVTLVALSPGGCADTIIQTKMVSLSDPGMADFRSTPEPPVEVSLPNSSTISFYDQSQLAVTWTWDFGDGVSSTDRNPNHTYNKPGVYYVTLTTKTADGCENTLRKGPYTVFTPELFVPNVFTPNNDGMNDGFLTNYGGDEAFLLQIFDRWGTKYFQTTNKNEAWQGTNLNGSKAGDGVYFYTLRIGDRNYSGNVTLMR